jgi:hypothetical protein
MIHDNCRELAPNALRVLITFEMRTTKPGRLSVEQDGWRPSAKGVSAYAWEAARSS